MRKFTLAGSKVYFGMFFLFFILCSFVAAVSVRYYENLQHTIRQESEAYLQEVARRIGNNIDRVIEDNFAVLNTMAASLEQGGPHTMAESRTLLTRQQTFWNFENILLIDKVGKAYHLDGSESLLTLDASVREAMLSQNETMTPNQLINNKEYILFSIPLEDPVIGGIPMASLAVSYAPSSFDQILSMNSFNEQAHAQIISKNGAVVVHSSSPLSLRSGYNIFSTLQSAIFDDDATVAHLQDELLHNRSGQIGFTLDNDHRYLVYTPLSPADWYLLTFVPVQVVNAKSGSLLQTTLVMCGVITVLFATMSVALIFIFTSHKRKLEQLAFVDAVTGGSTMHRFYSLASEQLSSAGPQQYALIFTNIKNFKVLNEQLGRQNCDTILICFNRHIESYLTPKECMGRIFADNFCLLLEYESDAVLMDRFLLWHKSAEHFVTDGIMPWGLPVMEYGVYVLDNPAMPFPQMMDRAKLALRETLRSLDNRLRCAFYDDTLRRRLFRETQLEDWMEPALEQQEFVVYLQPKYHLPSETIGGAEALVRWNSTREGMIYPNEFIPLFEKNGFIIRLDLFVFQEVCRTLRKWLDAGLHPMKISVNCSRLHFKDPDFLKPYIRIADECSIDRQLLEIELTESMVLENSGRLIEIIDDIRQAGFGCSMDDFGSGYSSLNLIQTIPVDTLKLDGIFFQSKVVEDWRSEAVVRNVLSMAKALSMETVAEGVEYRKQVDMLKEAGCDYVQGYVFAKPMDIPSFESLAFPELNHAEL